MFCIHLPGPVTGRGVAQAVVLLKLPLACRPDVPLKLPLACRPDVRLKLPLACRPDVLLKLPLARRPERFAGTMQQTKCYTRAWVLYVDAQR